jgi:peroxiredoxin
MSELQTPESESPVASDSQAESTDAISVENQNDFTPPSAQPTRMFAGVLLAGAGLAIYGYVLTHFWSSPWLGVHLRTPYAAYGLIVTSLILGLVGLRVGLGIWSPHAKLAVATLTFLACATMAMGGARFFLYASRGTRNPQFELKLKVGDRFPAFSLTDQNGTIHTNAELRAGNANLVVVYRGDFCPFARYELSELNGKHSVFQQAGLGVIAISGDPIDRSRLLSKFLSTAIPLLSDNSENLIGPMGLIQHHRDAEPDNAIPAFFLIDRDGVVRWEFTSPYYREQPAPETIMRAARQLGLAP